MNKKDTVRTNILNARDGYTFSIKAMAEGCKVDEKDVSNVTMELVRAAVLSKTKSTPENGTRPYYLYSVDKNIAALWFAKNPIGVSPTPRPYADPPHIPHKVKHKRRTPFIIAIDAEIAGLECKIKRLNAVRKEFA